jgi:hypothetical protein
MTCSASLFPYWELEVPVDEFYSGALILSPYDYMRKQ